MELIMSLNISKERYAAIDMTRVIKTSLDLVKKRKNKNIKRNSK